MLRNLPTLPTALAVSLCICCGGAADASLAPAVPALPLPSYTGRETELFDDVIDPSAVGAAAAAAGAGVGATAKDDPLLRERTQTGDAVVRARVVTVTSGPESHGDGWRIGFHTLETVAGKRPPDDEFTFVVDRRAPAAGLVRMLEARLIGATFVVFVRQFVPSDHGTPSDGSIAYAPPEPAPAELHFHFAKDDKDELGAVREASLLGEVR
jgi:hypothetical protein